MPPPSEQGHVSVPPASLDDDAGSARRRRGSCCPCCRPSPSRLTGMRSRDRCSSVAASLRAPMSSGRRSSENICAPPTRTASRRAGDAPSAMTLLAQRGHRAVGELQRRARRPRRSTPAASRARARPPTSAWSTSASPMHEPRPMTTSTSPGRAATPRSRPCAPSSRARGLTRRSPGGRGARRRRSCSGPAGRCSERLLALDLQARVEQQSEVAVLGARSTSTVATTAPSMSVVVCGGLGSMLMPVICANAPTYEEPRMLPISRERGGCVLAGRVDAEQPQMPLRVALAEEQQGEPLDVADDRRARRR